MEVFQNKSANLQVLIEDYQGKIHITIQCMGALPSDVLILREAVPFSFIFHSLESKYNNITLNHLAC